MSNVIVGSSVGPTDLSGTIASGGVAQDLAAADSSRRGFWIQNQSAGDLWINEIGGTAQAGQPSFKVAAGDFYEMPITGISYGKISVFGATGGQAFAARQW
jgi:hypothetical protein